jgi:hypothetical protein
VGLGVAQAAEDLADRDRDDPPLGEVGAEAAARPPVGPGSARSRVASFGPCEDGAADVCGSAWERRSLSGFRRLFRSP